MKKHGFDPSKEGFVYLLKSDDMFKVGITDNIIRRIKQINKKSKQTFTTVFYEQMHGAVAKRVERLLLKWLTESHKQPTEKFDGYKECFYINNTTFPEIIDKILLLKKELSCISM